MNIKLTCFKSKLCFIRLGRINWLWILGYSWAFVFLEFYIGVEKSFSSENFSHSSLSDRFPLDTVSVTIPGVDTLFQQFKVRLDLDHHLKPLHPYFRDRYRIIRDLRRLVLLFNYRAVHGYEPISDLIDICRSLPESKQTKLIGTAFLGGIANLISEETNKQLKKRKVDFFQWKLEKIVLRNRFKYFYLYLFGGISTRGFGLHIPSLRIGYSRELTAYYTSEYVTFLPFRRLGLCYERCDGHNAITPFISSALGTVTLSYDHGRKLIRSTLDLRNTSAVIIRMLYINFLDRINSDQLLSEVLIFW